MHWLSKPKWILCIIALLMVVFVWRFYSTSGGPLYRGHAVDFWFQEYCRAKRQNHYDSLTAPEATDALRYFGSNAVPELMKMAFLPDATSAARQARNAENRIIDAIGAKYIPTVGELKDQAITALRELKPPASVLLPLLNKHLGSTNWAEYRESVYLLGCVGSGGEQVVGALTNALCSADPGASRYAIYALGGLGPQARAALPALTNMLRTSDKYIRPDIFRTLGQMGTNAVSIRPLVEESFAKETAVASKCRLAVVLCRIDPNNERAVNYMTNALESEDRLTVIAAMGDVGESTSQVLPCLFRILDEDKSREAFQAANSLQRLGVSGKELARRLNKRLEIKRGDVFEVAGTMLRLDPSNADAIAAMIALSSHGTGRRMSAITELGRVGPSAAQAIPVLCEIAKTGDTAERNEARKALKRIESTEW